jgi:hypothetical protein
MPTGHRGPRTKVRVSGERPEEEFAFAVVRRVLGVPVRSPRPAPADLNDEAYGAPDSPKPRWKARTVATPSRRSLAFSSSSSGVARNEA